MRPLGIRARTALLCGATVAAVALLALAVSHAGEQAMVRRYYRNALKVAVDMARDDIHYERGRLEIDRQLDNPSLVRMSVYGEDDALLYGKVIVSAPLEADSYRRCPGRDGADWYVYDERLDMGDDGALWLRACVSAGTLSGLQAGQRTLLRLMVPLLAGLAGLCGWLIARRILRPVDALTATAASIADGRDLARRIPLHGPRDELWRMGQVYNDMLGRLDQAFERERRFSADAAHELRTPVAAILCQAEYALSDEASEADRRAALDVIRQRSGDMSALIGALLQLARIESGQTTLTLEDVALDELCRLAADSVEEAAGEKGIAVLVEAPPAAIRGDQMMLTQAVLNLLDNAIRYNRPGGHVWVCLQSDGTTARVTVSDDGPGMSPEQMAHCFDRFWQADRARRRGSGLGLSLVARIARLHGGEATVDRSAAGGCAFMLALPVKNGGEQTC